MKNQKCGVVEKGGDGVESLWVETEVQCGGEWGGGGRKKKKKKTKSTGGHKRGPKKKGMV